MSLEYILKRVIREKGSRSDCSIYLSISLAYMEKENWIEAGIFLKLARQTKESYEEQVVVELIDGVLKTESTEASMRLLESIKDEG